MKPSTPGQRLVIDCHGHFTTTPARVQEFRTRQVAHFQATGQDIDEDPPHIGDDELRDAIENNQLKLMQERGIDLTIFSPRALGMDHQFGNESTNLKWARYCNDLIARICQMFPNHFAGGCQLPQASGVKPGPVVIAELERCVRELGFVTANLNPDPSGGMWTDPPLWDKDWWYPLYEKFVELEIPVMIHVSGSCNPHFNAVATHYINGDTTAFVQFMTAKIFEDFPTLKFIIPHGGGAVPYHWGRYKGIAQDMGLGSLDKRVLRNVFFDTCVYHQAGIDLLLKVVPASNIVFASEAIGAVRGIDPDTGRYYDDTLQYIERSEQATDDTRNQIYSGTALGLYRRLKSHPRFC
jgi:4-oxalmesaconate hydratase